MNEEKKAAKIALETRRLFPYGCIVRSIEKPDKKGSVQGYAMGGFAIYGFNALSCLKVRWGSNKTLSGIHRNQVERVDE